MSLQKVTNDRAMVDADGTAREFLLCQLIVALQLDRNPQTLREMWVWVNDCVWKSMPLSFVV